MALNLEWSRGCGTALVTPFTDSGAIDEACFKEHMDRDQNLSAANWAVRHSADSIDRHGSSAARGRYVTVASVNRARDRIKGFIKRTPALIDYALSSRLGQVSI